MTASLTSPSHVATHGAAGPLEVARHQHVLDHGLYGHLANQADEEELLDDGGGDCPQRRQS